MGSIERMRRAAVALVVLLLACTWGIPGADAGTFTRYLDPMFEVDITTGIEFGAAVGADDTLETLLLDLYEPRDDTLAERPALVYVHGGSFSSGDRSEGVLFGNEMASRGYVVVSIDYRLYPGAGNDIERYIKAIPAAQHDAQAAVRWLRANAETYRIDPDAIGVAGYSAGGITAGNVVYRSHDPGDSGNPGFPSNVQVGVLMAGGTTEVTAPAPPVIMIHGTEDTTVLYAWAKAGCDESVAKGNICELYSYPAGHLLFDYFDDWFPRIVTFVHQHLVLGTQPTPPPPPEVSSTTSTVATDPASTRTARPSFTG